MLYTHTVATNTQKVLYYFVKFSDQEFHERELVRRLGIPAGSANRALNELYASAVIRRRQAGKMFFYSFDTDIPIITEIKKIANFTLLEPLIETLKPLTNRIILYGSCALGTDTSGSDIDLFIVTNDRLGVLERIDNFHFPKGYEDIQIQSVIRTPVELLESGESDQVYLEEVERGITLSERIIDG
jgi:predicted nucleotidyltransferase